MDCHWLQLIRWGPVAEPLSIFVVFGEKEVNCNPEEQFLYVVPEESLSAGLYSVDVTHNTHGDTIW